MLITSYRDKLYFLDYLPDSDGKVYTKADFLREPGGKAPRKINPLVLYSYADGEGIKIVSNTDLNGSGWFGGPTALIGTPEGLFMTRNDSLNVERLLTGKLDFGVGVILTRFVGLQTGKNLIVSFWKDQYKPDSKSAHTGVELARKLTPYISDQSKAQKGKNELVDLLGIRDAFILDQLRTAVPGQRFEAVTAFQEKIADQSIDQESGEGLLRWLDKEKIVNFPDKRAFNEAGDQAMLSDNSEVGGIDLNPAILDLEVENDGKGVQLPPLQPSTLDMNIDGFRSIILNVESIENLPMVLGFPKNK